MWRPFASSFAEHTYANFVKRIDRVESAPLTVKRETYDEYQNSSTSSIQSISKEAQQRLEEFKYLREKVKIQRKQIKQTDYHLEKLKEFKIRSIKTMQVNEKEKKKQETLRIRALVNNKAPKAQSLSLKPKEQEVESGTLSEDRTFLTSSPMKPRKNFFKIFKPSTTRGSKRKKETISVREHQEQIMKELKPKVPTYFKALKAEFAKIREHCEMTFEEYNTSKRLRRTNPYKIRTKNKSLQYK